MLRISTSLFVIGLITASCHSAAQESKSSLSQAFNVGDNAGFTKAHVPKAFSFPQDHGPHPDFKYEWWYFTGNLVTAEQRRFGYQLTFFRIGLVPAVALRDSAWATSQIYMAHFALSDVTSEQFHHQERISRHALDLAGGQATPLKIWVNDWTLTELGAPETASCWGCTALRLKANSGDVGIDLRLTSTKPAVLHGDRGLSRKNAQPGNASYYYSLTRMTTRGTISVSGNEHQVDGLSWFDREWSTSALSDDQAGWDWFSLQLSNGVELMFYQLRRLDGSIDPFSSGTLVHSDGRATALSADDMEIQITDYWRSQETGVRYPNGWRLLSEREHLQLTVAPLLSNQEMDVTVRYWEGAVSVRGQVGARSVTGSGYVELTGYD